VIQSATPATSVRSASLRGNGENRQNAGACLENQGLPRTRISAGHAAWWTFERLCEAMDMPPNSTARRYLDKLEKDHLLQRAPGFPPRRGRPRRYTAVSCLRVLSGEVAPN